MPVNSIHQQFIRQKRLDEQRARESLDPRYSGEGSVQ